MAVDPVGAGISLLTAGLDFWGKDKESRRKEKLAREAAAREAAAREQHARSLELARQRQLTNDRITRQQYNERSLAAMQEARQYGQQAMDWQRQYGQKGLDALNQRMQQGMDFQRQYGNQARDAWQGNFDKALAAQQGGQAQAIQAALAQGGLGMGADLAAGQLGQDQILQLMRMSMDQAQPQQQLGLSAMQAMSYLQAAIGLPAFAMPTSINTADPSSLSRNYLGELERGVTGAQGLLAGMMPGADGAPAAGGNRAVTPSQVIPPGGSDPYKYALTPTVVDPTAALRMSPQFKIQQEEGERAINRALAARGLSSSSQALGELGDYNRKLIAGEMEKNIGRLSDMVNLGSRIGPSQIPQQFAGLLSNNLSNVANVGRHDMGLANIFGQGGINQANLFAKLGGGLADIYGGVGNRLSDLSRLWGTGAADLYSGLGTNLGRTAAGLGQNLGSWGMTQDQQMADFYDRMGARDAANLTNIAGARYGRDMAPARADLQISNISKPSWMGAFQTGLDTYGIGKKQGWWGKS